MFYQILQSDHANSSCNCAVSTLRSALTLIALMALLLGSFLQTARANDTSNQVPLETMEIEQVVALAQSGDAGAMMFIAHEMLKAGDDQWAEWVEKAAQASPQGSTYAGQFWLHGVMQKGGDYLVEPNKDLALKLLHRAARDNFVLAMTELGTYYNLHSKGSQPQPHVAYRWYQQAGERGDQFAQHMLQLMDSAQVRMGRLSLLMPTRFSRTAADNGKVIFSKEEYGDRASVEAWSEAASKTASVSAKKARKLLHKKVKRWHRKYAGEFSQPGVKVTVSKGEIYVGGVYRSLLTVRDRRHYPVLHLLQLDERDGMLHHLVVQSDDTLYGADYWMDYLIASMRINP